ncbi:hypothetical protein LG047_05170 [Methylocystis sp. WRRC1]|uniref:hypothetical protein n=1 Tax=Methylocystis sp. WRRC1 TaxID=1732014 RepID=UPI001D152F94|nr:hypothetical protein [Methylocystis sp. WRRC1]MCC3244715.1 hypothetical protein [Methylocystis sp. WRRC1]
MIFRIEILSGLVAGVVHNSSTLRRCAEMGAQPAFKQATMRTLPFRLPRRSTWSWRTGLSARLFGDALWIAKCEDMAFMPRHRLTDHYPTVE